MDYLTHPIDGIFGIPPGQNPSGSYQYFQTWGRPQAVGGFSPTESPAMPPFTPPSQDAQTDGARPNPAESLDLSPLGQKGRQGFTHNVADAYLGVLPPEALQNSEQARNALLDPSIPENRRKLLSNALRSIPRDHMTMLNMDGVKIKMEDKGKHYAHYRKKDSTIYVSAQMMKDLEDPARSKDAEKALRHEIGHAVIDSLVLRQGTAANSFTSYLDIPPAGPTLSRVEQARRRSKGEIRVDDAREERLADIYADLFSPYQEDKNGLSNTSFEEVQLWAQSLTRGYQAGKEKPITPIVHDYKESPGYKQAEALRRQLERVAKQLFSSSSRLGWPQSSLFSQDSYEEQYKKLHEYYQRYAELADLDDDPWGHWR